MKKDNKKFKKDNKKFTAYTIDANLWNMLLHYREVIEALLEERRWIPVSERLPEEDCYTFIYYRKKWKGLQCLNFKVAKYCKKFDVWQEFIGTDSDYSRPDYWMPLPEPPEEGE